MAKDRTDAKRDFSNTKRICTDCRHSGGSPTLFCFAINREPVQVKAKRGNRTVTRYRASHGLDMLRGVSKYPHPFAHNINTDYRCLLFEPKPHKSTSYSSWGITKLRKASRPRPARKSGNDPK